VRARSSRMRSPGGAAALFARSLCVGARETRSLDVCLSAPGTRCRRRRLPMDSGCIAVPREVAAASPRSAGQWPLPSHCHGMLLCACDGCAISNRWSARGLAWRLRRSTPGRLHAINIQSAPHRLGCSCLRVGSCSWIDWLIACTGCVFQSGSEASQVVVGYSAPPIPAPVLETVSHCGFCALERGRCLCLESRWSSAGNLLDIGGHYEKASRRFGRHAGGGQRVRVCGRKRQGQGSSSDRDEGLI
jgi:hypothetical protein